MPIRLNWLNTASRLFCVTSFLVFLVPLVSAEPVSLNGTWRFSDANFATLNPAPDRINSQPVKVPGNWYLQGIDHAGKAWYRRGFKATSTHPEDIHVLKFAGVDYLANVWVNEQHAGFHEGYFAPFRLDISAHLDASSDQRLAVLVDAPLEKPGPSWSLHKRILKGVLSHHDTRPGGAWTSRGQEKSTGGIWEAVTLERSQGVYLDPPQVTPHLEFDKKGVVRTAEFQVQLHAPFWRQRKSVQVDIEIFEPGDKAANPRRVASKSTKLDARKKRSRQTLSIADPKLWWPAGRGAQPLYQIHVTARDKDGNVLHQQHTQAGLRSVAVTKEGTWLINNRRLFLKGTNYIASQWKSEMTSAAYRKDLQLMLDAHINVVRVHAHLESKRFYEEADAMGMLVWQDFPLQWGYEESAELEQAAHTQLGEMVQHFHNHPSIVAWSLHNEPPWDADWMKWKYHDYQPGQNKALDKKLFKQLKKLDTSRYLHAVSLTSEHPWYGWYSATPWKYTEEADTHLITEFGAQALPVMKSLRKIIPKAHLWPQDEADWRVWEYHNFQQRETFEIAKLPRPTNLNEFIEITQDYQSLVTRVAAESYRRQMYKPVTAIFQFMFVEGWPSINWGIVDYFRQPKPAYQALQQAYAPVQAHAEQIDNTYAPGRTEFPIWLINDLWEAQDAEIQISVVDERNKTIYERTEQVTAAADSAIELKPVPLNLTPGRYHLQVDTKPVDATSTSSKFSFEVTR